MGLDRNAAAMMVAASDDRGPRRRRGRRVHGAACSPNTVRPRCSRPTTPTRARRSSRRGGSRSRPSRPRGRCCSRTSGCRCPRWPTWSAGVEKIAAQHDVMISVIAHAGDGNTHPLIVFDPADADDDAARPDGLRRDHGPGRRPRRHDHRRARRRPAQAAVAGGLARARGDGAQPAHQGGARPGQHPQPRRGLLAFRFSADGSGVGGASQAGESDECGESVPRSRASAPGRRRSRRGARRCATPQRR